MGDILSMFKSMLGLGSADPSVEISPQEAFQRLKGEKPPHLVDVRSLDEHRQGRIAGSKLIPLHELGVRLDEIDRNKPVLLYCHSGNRSSMALRLLKGQGFTQAAHIAGGMSAWRRNGLPIESR